MIRRTLTALALTATLGLTVVACGDSGGGSDSAKKAEDTTETTAKADAGGSEKAGAATVDIADFAFDPDTIEVKKGDTVTFTNSDSAAHTATSKDGDPSDFDTDKIAEGDKAEVELDQAGTYEYYCSIHDYMTGTIEVK